MMNENLTYNMIVVCISTFLIFAGLLTSTMMSTIMVNASSDLGSGNNSKKNNTIMTFVGPTIHLESAPIKLKPTGNDSFTFGPLNTTQQLKPTGNDSFTFGPNTTQPKP